MRGWIVTVAFLVAGDALACKPEGTPILRLSARSLDRAGPFDIRIDGSSGARLTRRPR